MSEYIVRMPSDMPYEIKAELNAWYVNSEPIVRCKDCKHRAGANVQAVVSDLCMWLNIIVEPDGFCAWGVRRDA